MISTKRSDVDLEWGQIHYRSVASSEGSRPLALLHQSPLSSRMFDKALPALARSFNSVAIDTPGFGESDPTPAEWSVEQYAQEFWHVLDKLGIQSTYLLGRATGAVFAVEMALQQPDRLEGLILHGVPVYSVEECNQRLREFAPPYEIDADGNYLHWIWVRIQEQYPWASADLVASFVRDYLSAGEDFAAAYRAIWRYDMHDSLSRLTLSPALLSGDADRIGFMQARARAALPDALELTLRDATDFIALTDPEAFATTVEKLFGIAE